MIRTQPDFNINLISMENQFVFKVLEIFHQEESLKTAKQESEYFDIPLDDDEERVKEEIVEVPLNDDNDLVLQKKNERQVEIKNANTKLDMSSLKSDALQHIDSEETPLDSKENNNNFLVRFVLINLQIVSLLAITEPFIEEKPRVWNVVMYTQLKIV